MSRERTNPEKWRFTNALMRQAIMAIGEVMGERGLNVVLRQAGLERYVAELPPNDLEQGVVTVEYAKLNQAVEEFYGRAGRGMLKRIGRASFRYGVEEQATLMGVASTALKLMPQKTRVKFILTQMAKSLMDVNDETYIEIQETSARGSSGPRTRIMTCAKSRAGRWAPKPVASWWRRAESGSASLRRRDQSRVGVGPGVGSSNPDGTSVGSGVDVSVGTGAGVSVGLGTGVSLG
jgi:hypothetical protein